MELCYTLQVSQPVWPNVFSGVQKREPREVAYWYLSGRPGQVAPACWNLLTSKAYLGGSSSSWGLFLLAHGESGQVTGVTGQLRSHWFTVRQAHWSLLGLYPGDLSGELETPRP